eukprot:7864094-Lingulodinium_polyedra.AAC.1
MEQVPKRRHRGRPWPPRPSQLRKGIAGRPWRPARPRWPRPRSRGPSPPRALHGCTESRGLWRHGPWGDRCGEG